MAPAKISFPDWKPVSDLTFATEFEVTFPSPVMSGYPKNDQVPLRIFVPLGLSQPVPVVLVAHYWGATDLKPEFALAKDLAQRGIAAAVMTLPFHMDRTPSGSKSGELAIQPDPERLKQMMYQSEEDARRCLDFLDQRPEFSHDRYGMVGISLGALVAALTYAVDPRVRFATFALGGADFAHIIWTSSRVPLQREILKKNGFDEEKLREALSAVEPLTYLPRRDVSRSFVIEGKFDTVVPPKSTEELIEKLGNPQILKIGTGHYGGILVEGKILRTVSEFFAANFNGRNYAAPKRFSAVTLRIGGLLAFPQGADLGAGVDLFHLDPAGKTFGSAFVTPRGIRFFLGNSVFNGFALGLVGSNRGLGLGMLFSVVL